MRNVMCFFICAMLLIACTTSCGGDRNYPSQLPFVGEIPIVAWHGVRADFATPERFKEAREMGITLNYTRFSTNESALKGLDAAKESGVKLIVECDDLYKVDKRAAAVKLLMNHPALAGYFVMDEPICAKFAGIKEMIEGIQAIDNKHFCYSNLYPTAPDEYYEAMGAKSYNDYVQRYINEVPIKFISFDHYPIIIDPMIGPERQIKPLWYQNLEIISAEAKKAKMDFWGFALTTAHFAYPIPLVSDLRLQLYSNLVYGAQVLQYFTYWTPGNATGDYHEGPIEQDGTRTATYATVQNVTAEIQKLNGVFLGAKMDWVRHTGSSIPFGTQKLTELPAPVKKLQTKGVGAVVSQLRNQGFTFLVIQNRDPNANMQLNFEAESYVRMVKKDGSIVPANSVAAKSAIEPGNIVIFMW